MTRYLQNLFIHQRSIRIKLSIVHLLKRKSRNKNPKAFIDYCQTIDDIYENLEDYNPTKKRRVNSAWWCDCRYGM